MLPGRSGLFLVNSSSRLMTVRLPKIEAIIAAGEGFDAPFDLRSDLGGLTRVYKRAIEIRDDGDRHTDQRNRHNIPPPIMGNHVSPLAVLFIVKTGCLFIESGDDVLGYRLYAFGNREHDEIVAAFVADEILVDIAMLLHGIQHAM